MNKILKLVYSNKFFAITTLLIQVGVIAAFIVGISNNIRFYLLASNFISAVLILFEVNRHEETAFKITWIMLIAIIPIFGWFFYIYTHTGIISHDIMKAQKIALKKIAEFKTDDSEIIKEMDSKNCETSLVKYLSNASGNSVYKNSSVKYYPIGEDMFTDMLAEIRKAEKFIFLEFFIISQNSYMWRILEDLLVEKAKSGVDVRLMYDGMGCIALMPKGYEKELEKKGIKCQIFAPVQPLLSTYQNNRDHRKVIVIDGRCAFSGGINLSDEYINKTVRFGHWKDTGLMVTGEAVCGFTEMFLTMWCTASATANVDFEHFLGSSKNYSVSNAEGYITPYCDSPLDDKPVGRNSYMDILNTAKKYVFIMTPYFVIDEAIYDAMSYAVTRGVKVRLILPGIPDKKIPYCLARSYYEDLFKIGVEVYEYTPGFVHAKTTVSDGRRAIVGTINYDYRSLYLHYECAAYLSEIPQIKDIEDDFIRTLSKCRRVTKTEYEQFPWFYRIAGHFLRFIATVI